MKVDILGITIDSITMDNAIKKVLSYMKGAVSHTIYTPNAEMVMEAVKNPLFRNILNSASLLLPDGAGVVLGARILKTPIKEKVAGVDFIVNVFASGEKISVFLLGGAPGVAAKAALNINSDYKNISICGEMHGFYDGSYEADLIRQINDACPDFLLVALGVPRQEIWIHNNLHKINAKVCIGCGGCFDIFSGNANRAPKLFIRFSAEWLYRLIKQPQRFKRMLRIPVFLFLCVKKRLLK